MEFAQEQRQTHSLCAPQLREEQVKCFIIIFWPELKIQKGFRERWYIY